MTAIIARLEAATEGSRELDVAIYRQEFPYVTAPWPHEAQLRRDMERAPHYTTSIDAALMLVPGGFAWRVKATNVDGAMEYSGQVNYEKPSYAPTPALALCIAALKARSVP